MIFQAHLQVALVAPNPARLYVHLNAVIGVLLLVLRGVILALGATIDGQTTAHYIADELQGVTVTSLAQGVPVGGELDYLDDGTITAALNARKSL